MVGCRLCCLVYDVCYVTCIVVLWCGCWLLVFDNGCLMFGVCYLVCWYVIRGVWFVACSVCCMTCGVCILCDRCLIVGVILLVRCDVCVVFDALCVVCMVLALAIGV